ncbi:DNA polymerase beta thumb [Popillia japonica]|uniref:DNA polymerase n=1 Tax=Popillia japonica TaxID=7064 RepID=A0AAW1N6Z8_POPJA
MGVCRLESDGISRRLDIHLTPFDQYYCSILYFTGSDMFNRGMRAHAAEKGFILNEHALRPIGSTGSDMFNRGMRAHAAEKGFILNEHALRPIGSTGVPGEPVPISSERDIFDCIEYDYREPKDRY